MVLWLISIEKQAKEKRFWSLISTEGIQAIRESEAVQRTAEGTAKLRQDTEALEWLSSKLTPNMEMYIDNGEECSCSFELWSRVKLLMGVASWDFHAIIDKETIAEDETFIEFWNRLVKIRKMDTKATKVQVKRLLFQKR